MDSVFVRWRRGEHSPEGSLAALLRLPRGKPKLMARLQRGNIWPPAPGASISNSFHAARWQLLRAARYVPISPDHACITEPKQRISERIPKLWLRKIPNARLKMFFCHCNSFDGTEGKRNVLLSHPSAKWFECSSKGRAEIPAQTWCNLSKEKAAGRKNSLLSL